MLRDELPDLAMHRRQPRDVEWTCDAAGAWSNVDYRGGTWFIPKESSLPGIYDLACLIKKISTNRKLFVVRGLLTPAARAGVLSGEIGKLRRKKNADGGQPGNLIEAALPWCCIDVDHFFLRAGDNLVADPETVIRYAISKIIPAEFHDVTVC